MVGWQNAIKKIRDYQGQCPKVNQVRNWLEGNCPLQEVEHKCNDCSALIKHPRCLISEIGRKFPRKGSDPITLPASPVSLQIPLELEIQGSLGLMQASEGLNRILGHIAELSLCRKHSVGFTPEMSKEPFSEFCIRNGINFPPLIGKLTPDHVTIEGDKLIIWEFGLSVVKWRKKLSDEAKWSKMVEHNETGKGPEVEVRVEVIECISKAYDYLNEEETRYAMVIKNLSQKVRRECVRAGIWNQYDSLIAAANDGVRIVEYELLPPGERNSDVDESFKAFMENHHLDEKMGPCESLDDIIEEARGWNGRWLPRSKLKDQPLDGFITSTEDRKEKLELMFEKVPVTNSSELPQFLQSCNRVLDLLRKKLSKDEESADLFKKGIHLCWDGDSQVVVGSHDSLHIRNNEASFSHRKQVLQKKCLLKFGRLPLPKFSENCRLECENVIRSISCENKDRKERATRERETMNQWKDPSCIYNPDVVEMRGLPHCDRPPVEDPFWKYMENYERGAEVGEYLKQLDDSLPNCVRAKEDVSRMAFRLCLPTYRTPGSFCFFQSDGNRSVYTRNKGTGSRWFYTGFGAERFKLHPERIYPVINLSEAIMMVFCRAEACGVKLNDRAITVLVRIVEHQSKATQELLQGMRYYIMACKSEFFNEGLIDKLSVGCRNRSDLEMASLMKKWMQENATLRREEYFSFLNGEVMTTNIDFLLLEMYLCHLITKRDSSSGKSLQKCFEKFMKPKEKYFKDTEKYSDRLLYGKNKQNISLSDIKDPSLPLYSRTLFKEFKHWISKRYMVHMKNKLRSMPEPALGLLANPKSTVITTKQTHIERKIEHYIKSKVKVRETKADLITGEKVEQFKRPCTVQHPTEDCLCEMCEISHCLSGLDLSLIAECMEDCEEFSDAVSYLTPLLEDWGMEKTLKFMAEVYHDGEVDRLSELEKLEYLTSMKAMEVNDFSTPAELLCRKLIQKRKDFNKGKANILTHKRKEEEVLRRKSRYSSRTTTSIALMDRLKQGEGTTLESRKGPATLPLYFGMANKEQIGGTRELFIGDLETKLVTKRMEEIGRRLTTCLDNSCLNDHKAEDSFRDLLTGSLGKTVTSDTMCLTLDHSKWGPTQCVDAYIEVFEMIFPDMLRSHITDLKRHLMKRVEIPHLYIERLIRKKLSGGTMTDIEEYVSKRLQQDEPWVACPFDMGQGILHNHSDILGALTEEFICERAAATTCVEKGMSENSITFRSMNTSDDSCLFVKCTEPKPGWKLEFLKWHSLFSELLNKKISAKSTCDSTMAEFKSRFITSESEIPATIKFTACVLHGLNISSMEDLNNSGLSLSINAFNQGATVEECRIVQKVFNKLQRMVCPEYDPMKSTDLFLPFLCFPSVEEMMMLSQEAIILQEVVRRTGADREAMFLSISDNLSLLERGKITAEELLQKASIPEFGTGGLTCLPDKLEDEFRPIKPKGRGKNRELLGRLRSLRGAVDSSPIGKMKTYLDGKLRDLSEASLDRTVSKAVIDSLESPLANLMQCMITLVYSVRGRFYRQADGELVNLKGVVREGSSRDYILNLVLRAAAYTPWSIKQLCSPEVIVQCSKSEGGSYRHFSRDANWVEDFTPEVVEKLISMGEEGNNALRDFGIRPNRRYRKSEERMNRLPLMFQMKEVKDPNSSDAGCLRMSDSNDACSMFGYCYLSGAGEIRARSRTGIQPQFIEGFMETSLCLMSMCNPGLELTSELIHKVLACFLFFFAVSEVEAKRALKSYEKPSKCIQICRMLLESSGSVISLRDITKLCLNPVSMITISKYNKEGTLVTKDVWDIPTRKGRVNLTATWTDEALTSLSVRVDYLGEFTKDDYTAIMSNKTLLMCSSDLSPKFSHLMEKQKDCPEIRLRESSISTSDWNVTGSMRLINCGICITTTNVMNKVEDYRETIIEDLERLTGAVGGEWEDHKHVVKLNYYKGQAASCIQALRLGGLHPLENCISSLERKAKALCEVHGLEFNETSLFKLNSKFLSFNDVLSEASDSSISCKRDLEVILSRDTNTSPIRVSLLLGRTVTPEGFLCYSRSVGSPIVVEGSKAHMSLSETHIGHPVVITGSRYLEMTPGTVTAEIIDL
ncbi:L protein [Wenling frogfish arenavirus 1]|uniref:RNA-directed RNA polymerase L n=1 Tax=Wenling frogfish arenavirus 1 TaxID=2116466 RepID=A0A2P1GNQ9_9VIRU|nr:L protein [Wenling frogfish arenavirus 1]AVM87641.1 L protein [Wenling frogfish arenavirus 1]